MNGRNAVAEMEEGEEYRYGFNGKEKDVDFDNHYDYGFRIYNPTIAKFLSVDPLTKEYPWYTPYQFAGNTPIMAIDLDGLEEKVVIFDFGEDKPRLYFADNNSEGEDAISYYYSIFTKEANLEEKFLFNWVQGYMEYSENGGPNGYGTLTVKQNEEGTYDLSYSRHSAKPHYQVLHGLKSGYSNLAADTRSNRIGKRMTLAIATAPFAAGTSVIAGLQMTFLGNELFSTGASAANSELESNYSGFRSLATEYGGEAGGEYYDYFETAIKGLSFGVSMKDVFYIKTWADAIDKGSKAIVAEIDLIMDIKNKSETKDSKEDATDNNQH